MNPGDRVTLSHFFAGGRRALQDATGRKAPSFRDLLVQAGAGAPAPLRADVAGTSLRVVFRRGAGRGLRAGGQRLHGFRDRQQPERAHDRGHGHGEDHGKRAPSMVTLAGALRPDEQASVSYTKPASNPLRAGAAGNAQVENFSGFAAATSHDVTAPKLVSQAGQHPREPPKRPPDARASPGSCSTSTSGWRTTCGGPRGRRPGTSRCRRPTPRPWTGAAVVTVSVEDTAVVLTTSHWLKDNIDYTLVYTPGTYRIRDLAGNPVAGFTETVRSFSVGQPVLRGSTVTGTKLELNMANPLNPGAVPPPSAFALWETDRRDGETDLSELTNRVLSVRVQASEAVLQLAHPVYPCAGQRVFRVSYTPPESGSERFQTAAGWGAEGWTAEKWRGTSNDYALVTNAWHGRCAEWLAGTFMGSVVLKSERPFARDRGEPEPAWFTVRASGGPVTVTGAAFSPDDPKELKLSLSREFAAGETVTVSYRRPAGASGLWDTDGNQLRDVVDAPVRAKEEEELEALTAEFHGLPTEHDGRRLFAFEIRFSEEFRGLRLTALKEALQVTGGRVVDTKRTARGQNRSVTVRVRPDSGGNMTLTLPAATDCSAVAAICASDGREAHIRGLGYGAGSRYAGSSAGTRRS